MIIKSSALALRGQRKPLLARVNFFFQLNHIYGTLCQEHTAPCGRHIINYMFLSTASYSLHNHRGVYSVYMWTFVTMQVTISNQYAFFFLLADTFGECSESHTTSLYYKEKNILGGIIPHWWSIKNFVPYYLKGWKQLITCSYSIVQEKYFNELYSQSSNVPD